MKFKGVVVNIGDIVHVVLEDHADRNGDEQEGILIFEAIGRVVSITKRGIDLQYWGHPGAHMFDENSDITCVAKRAILSIKKLK